MAERRAVRESPELAQLRAENERLRECVLRLKGEKAAAEMMAQLEQKAGTRRVQAVLDRWRAAEERRRAADCNRKQGVHEPRTREPQWTANDEALLSTIVAPYETLCQQGRKSSDACHEVADRVGKKYEAVRSILRRMEKKAVLSAPLPPSKEYARL